MLPRMMRDYSLTRAEIRACLGMPPGADQSSVITPNGAVYPPGTRGRNRDTMSGVAEVVGAALQMFAY